MKPPLADLFRKPPRASVSLDDSLDGYGKPRILVNQCETGVFHDGSAFYRELEFATRIDLSTWTCTWPIPHLSKKIGRVLIGSKTKPLCTPAELKLCQQVAYHPSVHAKLYLCYNERNRLYQAFVGSQNFVEPTMCDLMIRAATKQLSALETIFNALWTQARILSASTPKAIRVSDGTRTNQETNQT